MKLTHWVLLVCLLPVVCLLTGCVHLWGQKGVFHDSSKDYQYALETKELTLPDSVDAKSFKERYPISNDVVVESPSLIPPGNPGSVKQ